jgi:protocatechuate 3,4-dioxygenase beta subunit
MSTPSFNFTVSYPGNLLEHSLVDLTVTNSSLFPPGTILDAWCLDKNVNLDTGGAYTGYVYSAYEPPSINSILPNNAGYVENLDSVNWLLNYYDGSNAQYTWGEVQAAIWTLMGQDYRTELSYTQTDGPTEDADVQSLVNLALAQDGYRPGLGESIAMIIDPVDANGKHGQPLVVEVKAASLGNRVWHDSDADGLQDNGEQGIAGAKVELVRDVNGDGVISTDEVLSTTTTDASGNYRFTGLMPGLQYQVRFTQPTGFDGISPRQADGSSASDSNSDGTLSDAVVLKAGEDNPTLDSGFYKTASLGDKVWNDTDRDGVQDTNETGRPNVKVELYNCVTSALVATTTTDANGNYLFADLKPGTYHVKFYAPEGMQFTTVNVGDDALDSDANSSGITGCYNVNSGDKITTVDAGLISSTPVDPLTAKLGDKVWLDTNNNGQQDAGEAGMANITVKLINAAGTVLATQTTDANGNYLFTGLAAGSYGVEFSKPTGYNFTASNAGADASDSDANTITGRTSLYTLAAGGQDLTVDAGLVVVDTKTASLGDRVWLDSNGNGQQDVGEAGVSGVTVNLYNAAGSVVGTQLTDGTGNYLFSNLAASQYSVGFVKPGDYNLTTANAGVDTGDSDADVATGRSGTYTLAIGEQNLTVDAGLVVAAKPCAKLIGVSSINEGTAGTYYVQLDRALDHDVTFTVKTADQTAQRVDQDAAGQNIMWGGSWDTRYVATGKVAKVYVVNPMGGAITKGTGYEYAWGPDGNDSWDYTLYSDTGAVQSGGYTTVTVKAGQTTSNSVSVSAWQERIHVDLDRNAVGYVEGSEHFSVSISGTSDKTLDICQPSVTTTIYDTTTYRTFSPIALDLDGNGIQTTALDQTSGKFDLLGDGTDVTTGWLSSGDAFLAVDASGNGAIDSVKELFGGNKGDGFAKLASYDGNGDGVVNAADARFAELLVWQDLNSNHQSDADELRSLAQAGIASLNVAYTDQEFTDAAGNVHGETGVATRADGSSIDMVDVYFNYGETSAMLDAGSLDTLVGTGMVSTTSVQAEVADFGDMTMVTELLRKIADMQVTVEMAA